MPDSVRMLLKVFRVELEETENDIRSLIGNLAHRLEDDEITAYVLRENSSLLLREIACLEHLVKDLDEWRPPEGAAPGEVIPLLKDYLHGIIEERDYPGLVRVVVDRKLDKAHRYIE